LILGLFYDAVSAADHVSLNGMNKWLWMKNRKGLERKRLWPVWRYYSGIRLEGPSLTKISRSRSVIWTGLVGS